MPAIYDALMELKKRKIKEAALDFGTANEIWDRGVSAYLKEEISASQLEDILEFLNLTPKMTVDMLTHLHTMDGRLKAAEEVLTRVLKYFESGKQPRKRGR